MLTRILRGLSILVILALGFPFVGAGAASQGEAIDEGSTIFLPSINKYYSVSKDPTTFVHAAAYEPELLDPAVAYETTAGEILMNIYDTLVFYDRESPTSFVPQIATTVPSLGNGGISPDGLTYTFHIRSGIHFSDGTNLTPEDVAYTFQRGLLRGGAATPQWLIAEPLLGIGIYDIAQVIDPALVDDPDGLKQQAPAVLLSTCNQVTNAITADNVAGTVTFHLAQPWGPFITTLVGPWASIQSKNWVSTHGGWDGDCATWQNYYVQPVDAFDQNPVGSGPYYLHHWTFGTEIELDANLNYWRTSPAWSGGPTGTASLKKVIFKVIPNFTDRLALLLSGDADTITAGSAFEYTQLYMLVGETCPAGGTCQPTPNPTLPLRMHTGLVAGSRTDAFLNWNINTTGGNLLLGSGTLDGNGIPPDFFSDQHVRKAFAYCFDYDAYKSQALAGTGVRSINVMLPGMIGYDPNSAHYDYDPIQCEQEFKASTLTGTGGSLWNTGFRATIPYNTGNNSRKILAQILKQSLANINPKFVIDVVEVDATSYSSLLRNRMLPVYTSGWVEDFHDPHNWVQPYTIGTFGIRQSLPQTLMDQFAAIIDAAVTETDPVARAAIYAQFNQLFYDQAPTLLLFITQTQRAEQRWVQGWYYNPAYFGTYYYSLYKW